MNLDQSMLVTVTAQHAHDLRRLIGAPLAPKIAPTASKVLMLTALNAAEIDLLQTIATLFPTITAQQTVCGHWTLQDLLGHLADWDRYFDNWLAGLTGNATQDLYWDEDGDRFNAWLCVQRQGERWEQTWADFRGNRQTLVAHLQAVSEIDFLREQPKSTSYPSVYHCAWSALEHYLDHAAGLRRELQMPIAEELWHFRGPYTE
ncbi:MAG: DinB family protein [Caldilineaceae bacterium]